MNIYTKILKNNSDLLDTNPSIYFAPGRVNLIGEHVDYNGGNVFPTAINLGTYAFVTKRSDKEFHLISENFRQIGKKIVTTDTLDYKKERSWANFFSGMLKALLSKNLKITHGLNIVVYGTLPNSSGLSSSASLELLIGVLLKDQYDLDISQLELVKTALDVENKYIGVNCGIMDQFAIGMSKKDYAIYLNTDTLSYDLVPLILGEYTLVIANTNKKRALANSKYNERRNECETGLDILNSAGANIKYLCQLNSDEFAIMSSNIKDNTIRRRVKHIVTEGDRTKLAVTALKSKNLKTFGDLINLSHDSLKNDYEVSCLELDTLVDSFRKHGSIGARMTGAGFGGCVIALIETKESSNIINKVKDEYQNKIGYNADFYKCYTSDGARKITKEEL